MTARKARFSSVPPGMALNADLVVDGRERANGPWKRAPARQSVVIRAAPAAIGTAAADQQAGRPTTRSTVLCSSCSPQPKKTTPVVVRASKRVAVPMKRKRRLGFRMAMGVVHITNIQVVCTMFSITLKLVFTSIRRRYSADACLHTYAYVIYIIIYMQESKTDLNNCQESMCNHCG